MVSILNMKINTTQSAVVANCDPFDIGVMFTDVAYFCSVYYNRSCTAAANYLSYSTIVSQVNAGKPIYSRVVFPQYNHAIVVVGYRDGGAMQVKIMDPDPKVKWNYQAYGNYVGSYQGSGYVTGSIYNFS